MAQKSVRKSGTSATPRGLFQPGPDPRRGRGPAKGTGGRPRNEFRQRCRELASDDAILEWFERVLRQEAPADPQIALRLADLKLRVWERLADRAYGKPSQPVTVGPDDSKDAEELRTVSDADLVKTFQELRHKAGTRN